MNTEREQTGKAHRIPVSSSVIPNNSFALSSGKRYRSQINTLEIEGYTLSGAMSRLSDNAIPDKVSRHFYHLNVAIIIHLSP